MKKNNAGKWRAGIVAGVAVHKSAAKRNFLKRQASETLRTALSETPDLRGKGPCDILVVLFPKVAALTKRQFKETFRAAVARAIT